MSAAAFLFGATLLMEWGWTCEAPVVLGDYTGRVTREYFPWKGDPAPYVMKIARPGPGDRHEIRWTIDPRPEGRPPKAKRRWPRPRNPSEAFRDGPDIVGIDFHWGPGAAAPIWAHYWGDGTYMGANLVVSVKQMERRIATNTSPFGSEGGLVHGPLLTRLSRARTWTVVVTDAAGTTRSSATFPVPTWEEAEAAFLQARSRIDAMELSYRNLVPLQESEASCIANEDPGGIVRLREPGRSDPA